MKNLRGILIFSFVLLKNLLLISQNNVNWLTFERTYENFTAKPKPILIFLYNPNDSLSEKMQKITFTNEEVVPYVNILFYPILFDVTTNDTITFFTGQKYWKTGKYHSLVDVLAGKNPTFPSLIIFDKNAQGQIFEGYRNRDSIFPILIYFAEEVNLNTNYQDWEKLYFEAYPPGKSLLITRLNVHWLTMNELNDALKAQKKKVLIDIYNNYSVSQTVMRLTVYNEPRIANYLKEKFHCVLLNYKSDEVFEFKGVTYKNQNPPNSYHDFAIAALQGKMRFPAFLILDEDLNLLDRIQIFTDRKLFWDIINYYGSNSYKTMDFKKFLETQKN